MIVEEEKRGYYRGVGEFHVFGKDADTPVLKDIVDFAVAKGLVLHAHCDDEALEILFRHNPKARVIWAHTGFSTPLRARRPSCCEKYPAAARRALLPLGRGRGRQALSRLEGDVHEIPDALRGGLRHVGEPALGRATRRSWAATAQWLGELPQDVAERIGWKNGAQNSSALP